MNLTKALPFVALGVVVACGRIGFDPPDVPAIDASLGDGSAFDGSMPSADGQPPMGDDSPSSDGPESNDGTNGPDGPEGDDASNLADAPGEEASTSNDASPGDAASLCSPVCTNAHGTTSCVNGTCVPVCTAGNGDCDGNPANGCETPLDTTSNCGTCGHACTADSGTAVCNGGSCGTSCNLTGAWAAKLTVQVTWPSSLTLAGGSGALQIWALLVNGAQAGNAIPATMVPCEITVPDFPSSAVAGNELYGLTFPNTLFDHGPPSYLPTVSSTLTLGGNAPGSTVSLPAVAFLVGLTMTNPTTDPWPSTPETVMEADVDQDGNPGVTTPYKSGGSYLNVPLNVTKSARADKAYLASRVVTTVSGTIGSCTSFGGTADVTNFDTHIVGCEVAGDAGACTQTQSDFTDTNRPAYVPGSATISVVKVANTATCATVRGAL